MHKRMQEQTKLDLSTKLDRPALYDRCHRCPIKQYHHMKSGNIYTKLRQVEREITDKLQKLKIECFGDDMMNAETQTALSNIYRDEKPVRMYFLAIEEKCNYFKIPKSSEALGKLWQEELEIIEKLQKLKLNLVKLDHKKKCFSTYSQPAYTWLNATNTPPAYTLLNTTYSEAAFARLNTRQKIEWKVKEIEELKQSVNKLYDCKRPRQIKDSDNSSLHEQALKLHKGRHHGRNNLVKERKVHKKINQAREELEKESANSPSEPVTRIYTWRGDILDTKEALTDYIKVTSREVEELRMKHMTYRAYDGRAELEKAAIENEIRISERKLDNIKQKKVFQTTTSNEDVNGNG